MESEKRIWLDSLKAGDQVIVDGDELELRAVARTTKTLIVIGEEKFRRSDGTTMRGDVWRPRSLRQPTDELLSRCEQLRLKRAARRSITLLENHIRLSRHTEAKLEKVIDLLGEAIAVLDPKGKK